MATYDLVNDFGAVADGITDDSGAIQDFLDAAESDGGGILEFPDAPVLWGGTAAKTFTWAQTIGFRGKGGNSIVRIGGGASAAQLGMGNINRFFIDNLRFHGIETGQDAGVMLQVQARAIELHRADFTNLYATKILDASYCRDLVINMCHFGGSTAAASGAAVYAENCQHVSVKNTSFIDWYNDKYDYYSKTWAAAPAWVKVVRPGARDADSGIASFNVEDCYFDEGADNAVYAQNLDFFSFERSHVNNSVQASAIHLSGVNTALVSRAKLGYRTNQNYQGIVCSNVADLTVDHLFLSEKVDQINLGNSTGQVFARNVRRDQTTRALFANTSGAVINPRESVQRAGLLAF